MTDQQINQAIAEECRWKRIPKPEKAAWGAVPTEPKTWWYEHQLPNYCADLNAMHEAEKTLEREQLDLYVDALICLIHEVDQGYFNRINWGHAVELTTATARQRAEAFLRTVGKWKE